MPINHIPNDPDDTVMQAITVGALADRPASRVRFVAQSLPAENVYPPGNAQFAAWQSRQVALATLDTFEAICGPLGGWRGEPARKEMGVIADAGEDINAYYTRSAIAFYHKIVGGQPIYSGASTDVVAHEAGHAILDALRPDLWQVPMFEVAAFHEGLGDVVAVMAALSNRDIRVALLAGGGQIARRNFVESTAEQLSRAIGIVRPGHNASVPRTAFNNFKWALPQNLPSDRNPGALIGEIHSFGQLVSGVYYDLICALFSAGATQTEVDLWTACRTATKLVVDGVRQAPVRPRFIETWGRSMMVIDAANGGANAAHIRAAFANHGITVGTTGFLTPQLSVGNIGLKAVEAGANMLTATAKRRLRGVLGVTAGTPLTIRRADVGDREVAEVAAPQKVDLTGLAEGLSGVVAQIQRPTLVGTEAAGLSLLGMVGTDGLYADEVRDFVAGLVGRSAIDFGGGRRGRGQRAGSGFVGMDEVVTHKVVRRGNQRTLTRTAFACRCGCGASFPSGD